MKQNVNLLNDLPKWEKSLYPFSLLIIVSIIFFVLLMLFYAITYVEYTHKRKIIHSLTVQQKVATRQLDTLQAEILKSGKHYKNIENAQKQIYDRTQKLSNNGSQDFYNILSTLGQQINPSVWLTNIDIQNSGKKVNLSGFTLQPQNAMNYVTSLNQTSLFSLNPFKLENIKKISNQQYLYIQLTTKKITDKE